MYRVTISDAVLQSSDVLCEIPEERYSILKDGKAVAVMLPSTEPNVWIMEPIYTEDWQFALPFVTVLSEDAIAELTIQPAKWAWLRNFFTFK